MVYFGDVYSVGVEMLSSTEVMELLGITKETLRKWMKATPPKIKSRSYLLGRRKYHGFSPTEVKRVKAKMLKKPVPGKGWFKD